MLLAILAAQYFEISTDSVPRPLMSAYNREMKYYEHHSIVKVEQRDVRGKGLDFKFTVDFNGKLGYVLFRMTPSNDIEFQKITWADPDAPKADL